MKINYLAKLLTIFILGLALFSTPVLAQNLQDAFGKNTSNAGPVQPGASETAFGEVVSGAGYDMSNTFDSMVGKIILATLSMLGIVFLILLIYAGFIWMTASGNEQKVSKAQSMITTAIIGLIIVLSAYSISFFVLKTLQDKSLDNSNLESTATETSF